MSKFYHNALILLTLLFCLPNVYGQGVQRPVYLDNTDAPYGFYEYLPVGYDTDQSKKFPLILFLHGAGEKGNGNSQLKTVIMHGPSKLIGKGRPFNAIVVSPQSPTWWNNNTLDTYLKWLEANYRIDSYRIYVTGLSMGGGGTWNLAKAYPERFAAIVPICGAASVSSPEKLINLPIWAFHNRGDGTVAVNNTLG